MRPVIGAATWVTVGGVGYAVTNVTVDRDAPAKPPARRSAPPLKLSGTLAWGPCPFEFVILYLETRRFDPLAMWYRNRQGWRLADALRSRRN